MRGGRSDVQSPLYLLLLPSTISLVPSFALPTAELLDIAEGPALLQLEQAARLLETFDTVLKVGRREIIPL